jgi:hypothetical protein
MWMEHDVQSIFKGPSSPYFPVRTTPLLGEPEIDDFVQQALEAADLNDVEESRRKNIIVPETRSERATPWTNRAGYLRVLAGKTITELYPLTSARVDMETEPQLEHIQRSVPTLIARCLEGVRDLEKRGWEVILFWLNSTKIGTSIDQPFQLYYDPQTVPRYSEYWLRFILFALRTFELNPGDNDVKYTTAQSQALYDLKELILKESPTDLELHSQLLYVSEVFISQEDFEGSSSSAIKYFCRVMGWDSAKERWRRAGAYTPFLAGMQFCMRVLVCEIVLPLEKKDNYTELVNPLELFKAKWEVLLVKGSPYPFHWVHSLLVYGMNVAKNEMGEDRIRFSDDKQYLYWQGRELNIESWRRFPGDILRTAEKLLCRELLFQSTDLVEPFNPYDMNEKEGCSDNKHWFADNIPGYKTTGRNTILKNLGARMKEIVSFEDGQMKWDPVAVGKYKRAHEKLLEYLSIGFNTLGGLTGRGQEMLSLLYHNIPETDRHVLLEDGQLVAATSYHKSQNVTDSLKVQVHVFIADS